MKKLKILLIALLSLSIAACASHSTPQEKAFNPYTSGEVSLTLKKGITTKAQVTNVFGAPNIVTQKSNGDSVWVYQKNMTVQQSSNTNSYLTVILAGISHNSSQAEQGSKTMTLIIIFGPNDVVKSFKSMTTSF